MKFYIKFLYFITLFLISEECISNLFNAKLVEYNTFVASKSLQNYVDLSVKPCENFYEFSCGKWIKAKKNEIKNNININYPSTWKNFKKFRKEADDGKYDKKSPAIKKLNKISKKCNFLKKHLIKNCKESVYYFKTFAYSHIYLRKRLKEKEIKHSYDILNEMIPKIKEELKIIIDEKDFLDKESKERILKKVENIKYEKNMYQSYLENVLFMENCFRTFKLNLIDDALKIYNDIEYYKSSVSIHTEDKCLRYIIHGQKFFSDLVSENAFYNRKINRIFINPDFLKEPRFNIYYPKSLNYGGIGFVIAHELIHSIDSENINHNYEGNNDTEILTPQSEKIFSEKTGCFEKQYNSVKEKISGNYINGTLTLDENIADNGAIKVAHRAYMKYLNTIGGEESKVPGFEDFTSEQLFFISFGRIFCKLRNSTTIQKDLEDVHSPGVVRIIMSLSNYEPFSKAFNCKKENKMNLKDKCDLWL